MEFSIDESPAVRALGLLFQLTEVHLWDGGSSEVRESPDSKEPNKFSTGDDYHQKSDCLIMNDFYSVPEDVELARQLSYLGLPLSFHNNKEKRNGVNSGKRKSTRTNNQKSSIKIDRSMLDSIKVNGDENQAPAILLDASEMIDQREILKHGIVLDVGGLPRLSHEQGDSLSSTACTNNLSKDYNYNCEVSDLGFGNDILCKADAIQCKGGVMALDLYLDDGTSEESCLLDKGSDSNDEEIKKELESDHLEAPLVVNDNPEGLSNDLSLEVMQDADLAECACFNHEAEGSGEWMAYWDDFHMRTYFYNVKTEESTWDPPPGMEHLAFGTLVHEPMNVVDGLAEWSDEQLEKKFDEVQALSELQSHLSLGKESGNDDGSLTQQFDEISGSWFCADNFSSTNSTKRKKKVRRTKRNSKTSISSEGFHLQVQVDFDELPPISSKYWWQRYLLFSKFDCGVKMDEEGWFSVTPEALARHHAVRCGTGAIVDFFTGVGGNAIQFAQRSKHVIAIDIDPKKIEYARHNASIYGVEDNIEFIKGDSFSLTPKLRADTVFMSPPWGGPDYSKVKKFDINTMLKPRDGQFLFDVGRRIATKIVMFLPRNVDINQLAELSLSASPPWSLEVEMNFLNDRLKAVTAYFCDPSLTPEEYSL